MTVVEVPCPPCPLCGAPSTVTVLAGDYERWLTGALVQHAFAEMPAPDRERLVSGTHPACWDAAFGDSPED